MLSSEQLLADSQAAYEADKSHRAVHEVVKRAVSDPVALMAGIGNPERAGITLMFRSEGLTILNLVWGPGMTIMPHNHNMWAIIGIYTGREDNIFWRRLLATHQGAGIEAAGARSIGERQTIALGADIIHSVANPVGKLTGAIHVYGGDFIAEPRLEWDPHYLQEAPFDWEKANEIFERSNLQPSAARRHEANDQAPDCSSIR
jgi:predicted metal-dependent enzyme (double-stranded beta helix superfamily)